jgi:hypothetical protein
MPNHIHREYDIRGVAGLRKAGADVLDDAAREKLGRGSSSAHA